MGGMSRQSRRTVLGAAGRSPAGDRSWLDAARGWLDAARGWLDAAGRWLVAARGRLAAARRGRSGRLHAGRALQPQLLDRRLPHAELLDLAGHRHGEAV